MGGDCSCDVGKAAAAWAAQDPTMLSTLQVIIPALNEEATIGAVVRDLRACGCTRIRVIDNGSSDGTAAAAAAAGAEVCPEPHRGYGQACWTGAQGLDPAVAWLAFFAADGSDRPDDLVVLATRAREGVDLVLGDRTARSGSRATLTRLQRAGNTLATRLIRWGWGHRFQDLGPLRVIRRDLFARLELRDRGYGWTLEMQVRAIELGARVVELPVEARMRRGGQSKISGTLVGSLRAGTVILTTLLRLRLRR